MPDSDNATECLDVPLDCFARLPDEITLAIAASFDDLNYNEGENALESLSLTSRSGYRLASFATRRRLILREDNIDHWLSKIIEAGSSLNLTGEIGSAHQAKQPASPAPAATFLQSLDHIRHIIIACGLTQQRTKLKEAQQVLLDWEKKSEKVFDKLEGITWGPRGVEEWKGRHGETKFVASRHASCLFFEELFGGRKITHSVFNGERGTFQVSLGTRWDVPFARFIRYDNIQSENIRKVLGHDDSDRSQTRTATVPSTTADWDNEAIFHGASAKRLPNLMQIYSAVFSDLTSKEKRCDLRIHLTVLRDRRLRGSSTSSNRS